MRNGKVALVTGSSTGIGAGCALALAREGYDVAVHYNSSPIEAEKVLKQIHEETDVRTCLLQGDTSERDVPERLVKETVEKLGRLDVDVNNAGITIFEEAHEITADVMDKLYNLNFRGMVLGAVAASKYMIENDVKGVILFNTSIRGFAPHVDDGIYGGLKWGLNRVIRSFALDLGPRGIRVNGFSPGVINVSSPAPEEEKENPFYAVSHKFIPLRRNGYASDIADAVCFLASDKASYITGQVLCVDGGMSIVGAAENMYNLLDTCDIRDLFDQPILGREEFMNAFYEVVTRQKAARRASE